MLMKTRAVDFHHVEEHQRAIDARLLNWAAWVRPRAQSWCSPMFRQAQSNSRQWHAPEPKAALDLIGAQAMEKAVSKLPEKHRDAIRWHYVYNSAPHKMCRHLGVSLDGLAQLVRDARQMLMNMGM